MSSTLIKSAKVIDRQSPFHNQTVDIYIQDGVIQEIGTQIAKGADEVIDLPDLHVSVGWCDMRCVSSVPGLEHKDDLESLAASAKAGGFSDLAILPNTQPAIQTRDAVQYLKSQSDRLGVNFHPIAALTKDVQGEQMTEILDLHHSGAVAFSDGLHSTRSTGTMMLALQYLQTINGLLIQFPDDTSVSGNGQMHEGITSTRMGMKGIPALAEEIAIMKDLALLRYTGGRIHFSNISTAQSVETIRQAKAEGLQVTADVAAFQVYFTDMNMMVFDTNMKVKPPFRADTDHQAIWQGLQDGTIDAITSSHHPQDTESKELEFDLADFGILGLETAFGTINTRKPANFSIEELIEKLTTQPRNILGLPQISIAPQSEVHLTLFQPNEPWVFSKSHIHSKSNNTPFVGELFNGKVVRVL